MDKFTSRMLFKWSMNEFAIVCASEDVRGTVTLTMLNIFSSNTSFCLFFFSCFFSLWLLFIVGFFKLSARLVMVSFNEAATYSWWRISGACLAAWWYSLQVNSSPDTGWMTKRSASLLNNLWWNAWSKAFPEDGNCLIIQSCKGSSWHRP